MHNVVGNLWTVPAKVRCVTTNGQYVKDGNIYRAIMGKGTALQAAIRYPDLSRLLGRDLKNFGNRVYSYPVGDNPQLDCQYIVTLPTKNHWRDSSDPMLVALSMQELVYFVDAFRLTDIVLPEPGTGAGNLSWEAVEPIVNHYLDDRFTIVHME